MNIKNLFFGLVFCIPVFLSAQNVKKEVLFTIDGKPYYTNEFARVYKKNIDLVKDESQKDLNKYLELFIGYKLKINKANKLGLQDNPKYKAELASYRTQLAKNYLTDSKVTKELLEEAYQRSLKEVKVSHILLMVDENASPADTLKAWQQAMDIRKKAIAGEDFGSLAMQYSQDPSAKENKGDLGYFSAFRMVYAFESGAFNTALGQISQPVRTRFGYHLIKVNDVRANRGQVNVAHIMISKPTGSDPILAERARQQINDIYKKIQQGESFEALAAQFSDDKSSSSKGGILGKFSSGDMSSEEFENVSFSLEKPNDISQPFESSFGWHIVKLIEKYPLKKYEEVEQELESKVKRDDRSRLIAQSMNEKLRKKYQVKQDAKMFAQISKAVTEEVYSSSWTLPENPKPFEGTLMTIEDKKISGVDFLHYINKKQKGGMTIKPLSRLLSKLREDFTDDQLNVYYNENLEKEFPEFAEVMEEYRDGLLLFDLMEKEIWDKSKTDSLGLKSFYDKNLANYKWKNRVEGLIASSTKEDVIKKARKMLQQGKTADQIKAALNTDKTVNVMLNEGTFEEGATVLPSNVQMKPGVSDIINKDGYFYVTKVMKVLPASTKTLDEARGKVTNDYQQYLEDNWVTDLKKEFIITVNPQVFEEVKKEIKL